MSRVDLFETARKVARLGEYGATGDEGYDNLACDIDQEILAAAYELEAYRRGNTHSTPCGVAWPDYVCELPDGHNGPCVGRNATCKESLQVARSDDYLRGYHDARCSTLSASYIRLINKPEGRSYSTSQAPAAMPSGRYVYAGPWPGDEEGEANG